MEDSWSTPAKFAILEGTTVNCVRTVWFKYRNPGFRRGDFEATRAARWARLPSNTMNEIDDLSSGKCWVFKSGNINCQVRSARFLLGNHWQFEQRFAHIDPICSE
ncbi:MAG TPA: hypothetical protein DEF45_24095 [Rhodopirellula sp.]|nr:hypothetical protein [Rhodopirellula sp.]